MHPKRPSWQLAAFMAVIVLLGTTIALLRPQPVLSDEGLTALLDAAYLPRTTDAELHAIAHERAVEVSTDWSHNGRREGTAEVLAYNSGFADPVAKAVEQWQGSPDHDAILADPSYTRIGCGSHTDGVTTWFACVLAAEPVPQPTPAPVTSSAPPAGTEPALLPNTAQDFCAKRPTHPRCTTAPTATPTASATATPSLQPTTSPSSTPTPVPTATPTATPSPTATPPSSCPSSLQAAVNAAPSGSTLTIGDCTFHETVTISKPLTLVTNGGLIDGNTHAFVVRNTSDVTLDGWEVTGTNNPQQTGSVDVEGTNRFTFRNGYIHHTGGACISIVGGSDHQLLDSELAYCDQEGYHGSDFSGMVVAGNHIHHNNPRGFYSSGWEAGGGKFVHAHHVLFENNHSHDNDGPGLWVDWDVRDITFRGNVLHDNTRPGIFVECGDGALIENNVSYRNGLDHPQWVWGAGILVACSKNVEVRNNLVAYNADGIAVISQNRGGEWNTVTGNWVHDNDVILAHNSSDSSDQSLMCWCQDWAGVMFASGSNNRGTANRYWMNTAEPDWARFGWNGPLSTLSSFNATPGEDGRYMTTAERDAALSRIP